MTCLSLNHKLRFFFSCISGYMAPEYAIDGLFSVKSDVFSFGVLVLEIVSGKKNRGFNHPDHDLNLVGHVSLKVLLATCFLRCTITCLVLNSFPSGWNLVFDDCRHGNYGTKNVHWNSLIHLWLNLSRNQNC